MASGGRSVSRRKMSEARSGRPERKSSPPGQPGVSVVGVGLEMAFQAFSSAAKSAGSPKRFWSRPGRPASRARRSGPRGSGRRPRGSAPGRAPPGQVGRNRRRGWGRPPEPARTAGGLHPFTHPEQSVPDGETLTRPGVIDPHRAGGVVRPLRPGAEVDTRVDRAGAQVHRIDRHRHGNGHRRADIDGNRRRRSAGDRHAVNRRSHKHPRPDPMRVGGNLPREKSMTVARAVRSPGPAE